MIDRHQQQVVLVVTDQDDLAADKIILELGAIGADVVRLDLGAAPLRMDCELRGDQWHGPVQTGTGRPVQLADVGAVLWRWSAPAPGHPALSDPAHRGWAAQQDDHAVRGVLRSLPAFWMSHPDRLAAVEGAKPTQLQAAVRAGLRVPDTLISTSGAAAAAWTHGVGQAGRAHIHKPFHAPYRPAPHRKAAGPGSGGLADQGAAREALLVPTQRVPDELPEELYAALLFQNLIAGTSVRVTVVGEQLFAASIEPGPDVDFDLDWRPAQLGARIKPISVPDPVAAAIGRLMQGWGLAYGALDFIVRPGGEWIFLEINPTGAFGFVQDGADLPIAAQIARTLATAATVGGTAVMAERSGIPAPAANGGSCARTA